MQMRNVNFDNVDLRFGIFVVFMEFLSFKICF